MNEYKLPPRKWYTLEQATKRIKQLTGVELGIEDLLHYWQIGKIIIYTTVNYSSIKNVCTIGNVKLKYACPHFFPFNDEDEGYKIIDTEDEYCTIKYNIEENADNILLDNSDQIDGFIAIAANFKRKGNIEIERILNRGLDLNYFKEYFKPPLDYSKNECLLILITPFEFDSSEELNVSIDNLYILEKDLSLFFSGEIEKYLKVLSDTYKEEQEKTEHKFKQFSKTIQENQINFIRALLYMDYGIDTPQEAKNALNTGELGKKIERFRRENPNIETDKNFKFPSYVTLSNWYSKA
ncbi:hypothetical protein PTQ27_01240 [Mannheimia sp. AT1]|uniref:Uncharacterized protein n=1 Tax=Mannheimia cairinae TaxID=3025936 RepID=A0ABT5MLM2_9PAST|nr:hypothetical protein [Mannheimia cairinae]MDD0823098.1 hypothetical protein [Mannheimia cairinae]MDD0825877.1 hypothetical protein [Mannheimia cairinae]